MRFFLIGSYQRNCRGGRKEGIDKELPSLLQEVIDCLCISFGDSKIKKETLLDHQLGKQNKWKCFDNKNGNSRENLSVSSVKWTQRSERDGHGLYQKLQNPHQPQFADKESTNRDPVVVCFKFIIVHLTPSLLPRSSLTLLPLWTRSGMYGWMHLPAYQPVMPPKDLQLNEAEERKGFEIRFSD